MHSQDTDLLTAVAEGDLEAFEEIYLRHHRALAGFLFKMTRRRDLVEELVNDVMVVVWQKAGTFAARSQVSTWIMGIAYRKALKATERLGRRPATVDLDAASKGAELADAGAGPEIDVVRSEQRRRVRRALVELSPEHRAVVELAFYLGYSYREIAGIVGCPENTVKTRMFHARKKLRSALERQLDAEPDRQQDQGRQ